MLFDTLFDLADLPSMLETEVVSLAPTAALLCDLLSMFSFSLFFSFVRLDCAVFLLTAAEMLDLLDDLDLFDRFDFGIFSLKLFSVCDNILIF